MGVLFRWQLVCLLAGVAAVAAAQNHPAQSKQDVQPVRGAVRVQVRNGLFHVTNDVALSVARLDAWMIPKPGRVVSLDATKSFTLQMISGETHLKASDLTSLMNEYLLPHARSPINNVTVVFDNGMVAVKGELHKGVDVPFEGKGTVSIADPSDIRVHFTQLKAAGVLRKGLLDVLGIKLSQVAQPKKENRFHFEGDDMILPIEALFPPPRISGTLTAVRIEGDSLVQIFGSPGAALKGPPVAADEYIYFRGGRMQFGKLTMDDVDLELLNEKPAPQLDFSLDHYYEQMVNGYSKSLPDRGLVAYIPGYAAMVPQAKRD